MKNERLAEKSKSRVDSWLQGKTNSAANITDGHTLTMLNGLYRSQNPNLHDFRPPAGKLTTVSYFFDESSDGR